MDDPTATLSFEVRSKLQQMADGLYTSSLSQQEVEAVNSVNLVRPARDPESFVWNQSKYNPLSSQTERLDVVTNHYAVGPLCDPTHLGYITYTDTTDELQILDLDPIARGPEYTGTKLPGFFLAHTIRELFEAGVPTQDGGTRPLDPGKRIRVIDPTEEESWLLFAMGLGQGFAPRTTLSDVVSTLVRNHTIDPVHSRLSRYA